MPSRATIWNGFRGKRPASGAASTSTAIFWSARRPAADHPTAHLLWMRLPRQVGTIRRRVAQNSDEAVMLKFPRTIRLDPSDTFVFERAAEPGEWAVSGAFVFWNTDAAALEGKARSAFRGGFLGVASLGWSTLVQIV